MAEFRQMHCTLCHQTFLTASLDQCSLCCNPGGLVEAGSPQALRDLLEAKQRESMNSPAPLVAREPESLLDHLTTFENVALPLRVRGQEARSYRGDVLELLDWVGLGERINAFPAVLSGGEKQRAAIARAVVGQPQILLADEPTGNVDPYLAKRLLRLFVELNKLGTTVLIATHDLGLMEQFRAPRLVLQKGELHIVQ
jgi:ABC-type ATPase involved in cell division